MLAEIFMVRLEAEARLAEEVLPLSTSRLIPFSASGQLPSSNRTSRATKLQVKSGLSEWSGNRSGSSLSW